MANILVAFFSATGTTGVAATGLAKAIGADLFKSEDEFFLFKRDIKKNILKQLEK